LKARKPENKGLARFSFLVLKAGPLLCIRYGWFLDSTTRSAGFGACKVEEMVLIPRSAASF
jgi:hypothetical protein